MSGEMVLRGDVVDDSRVDELQDELRTLRSELRTARHETAQAKQDATRAMGALRKQLSPLYRALQAVFGELDAVGLSDEQPAAVSKVWANWKDRMPGGPAKVIDALLLHREMNQQQLCIATGVARGSMTNIISRLHRAGLISKNGKQISLKAL